MFRMRKDKKIKLNESKEATLERAMLDPAIIECEDTLITTLLDQDSWVKNSYRDTMGSTCQFEENCYVMENKHSYLGTELYCFGAVRYCYGVSQTSLNACADERFQCCMCSECYIHKFPESKEDLSQLVGLDEKLQKLVYPVYFDPYCVQPRYPSHNP